MGITAQIIDGKIANQTSSLSASKEASKAGGTGALDKDAFLQLLVTQMKYQDPMEPQDNSQMVSQLATFSSLEEMQNMAYSMDKSRASSLIGQFVTIAEKDQTGNIKDVEGVVDFVTFQGSDTYVSVGGNLYSIDSVESVVDSEYTVAVKLAENIDAYIKTLPQVERLTAGDYENVGKLMNMYSSLDSYQKSMLSSDALDAYAAYSKWYVNNTPVQNA